MIKSRIGELVNIRTKRLKVVSVADWNKCAWGKELNGLLLETNEVEAKLNPRTAQSTPPRYEEEFKLS